MTEDPAKDGTNWYVYCSNNPILLIDPWGLANSAAQQTLVDDGGSPYFSSTWLEQFYKEIERDNEFWGAVGNGVSTGVSLIVNLVIGDAQGRANAMLEDPNWYSIGNWLTSGIFDTVHGTFWPDKPLSAQHWIDSFGTAMLLLPGIKALSSALSSKAISVEIMSSGSIISSADNVIFGQSSVDKAFGKHASAFGVYADGSKASVAKYTNDIKDW